MQNLVDGDYDVSLQEMPSAAGFPLPGKENKTVVSCLIDALVRLGVTHAFGLVGGPIAPLADALGKSPLHFVHCRHETGAAFMATEASLATGCPQAVFVTTGPGLLNALNGLMAARWEGAHVIVFSGFTSSKERGRWPAQESSGYTMPLSGLYTAGPMFDFATILEHANELPTVLARLYRGVCRLQGFVAHVAVPVSVQSAAVPDVPAERPRLNPACLTPGVSPAMLERCLDHLRDRKFFMWVGHGARRAAEQVRAFAEHTGAAVMVSAHAKGTFPEDHPQFVGVTGLGGHDSIERYLDRVRPEAALVLGSRLAETTSYWSQRLVPKFGFVHVDVDTAVFNTAYPEAPTLPVLATVKEFLEQLQAVWPQGTSDPYLCTNPSREDDLEPRAGLRIRPTYLLQMIQRCVVDRTHASVFAEAGNAFAWCNHLLRFNQQQRYRISPHYGSMGHAATGIVGTALATGRQAIAIVGDGSMLMHNEVSTAVQYGAQAAWIVLNDSCFGMVEHGMRALGFSPKGMILPDVDFAQMAQAMGAMAIRVLEEAQLESALTQATEASGPVVVDVVCDPTVASPLMKRIRCLIAQGAGATRS